MERLNFNHFYYFYVVAREGSIKSAAEKLHISQPTISDQIKLLEEFFGCALFDRKNRSLAINENGLVAQKYAQRIFDLGKEVTYSLRHQADPTKTVVDIGITHFMSQYFLYDSILPLLNQEGVKVRVREGERLHLLAELEEARLDVLFTDSRESLSGSMAPFRVGLNRTFAVGHRKFQAIRRQFPSRLDQAPFFNFTSDSTLKFEIELFFAKYGLSPKQVGEADDIDLLQLVTEKGLAFTIVPEVAKNRFVKSKDVVVLGELTELQTSVWGVVKRGNPLGELLRHKPRTKKKIQK